MKILNSLVLGITFALTCGSVAASTEVNLIANFDAVCLQNPGDVNNSIESARALGAIQMPNEFAREFFDFGEGETITATLGISDDWETYIVVLTSSKLWKTNWLHCTLYHQFSQTEVVVEEMLPRFTQRAPFGLDENENRKAQSWTANNFAEQAMITIVDFTSSGLLQGTSLIFSSVISEEPSK